MTREDIIKIQGLIGTKLDGVWGPKSQRALLEWERHHDLDESADRRRALANAEVEMHQLTRWIDVSYHQGEIDWPRVAAGQRIQGVVVKATEGKDYVDPKATANLRRAHDAGLMVEAYHLARPVWDDEWNDPIEAAVHTKSMLIPREFCWLDLETKWIDEAIETFGLLRLWEWIEQWIRTAESGEDSIRTGIYLSHRGARRLGRPRIERPTWWADYLPRNADHSWANLESRLGPERRPGWVTWAMRQFSSSGSIEGIRGRVDLNWRRG